MTAPENYFEKHKRDVKEFAPEISSQDALHCRSQGKRGKFGMQSPTTRIQAARTGLEKKRQKSSNIISQR